MSYADRVFIANIKDILENGFSDEKLDDFAKRVAPMLNAEQRERLSKAIKMIKGD